MPRLLNWNANTAKWRKNQSLLWNSGKNCYFNRRWTPVDGQWFMPQMAPDIFFSLLGKVATPERVRISPQDFPRSA